MKMSKENYEKFKDFYDYTVENATDEDMKIIFMSIAIAAKKMTKVLAENKENGKN